jgi:hypothetical protein
MAKPTRPVTEGKETVITFNVIGLQRTIKAKQEPVLKLCRNPEAKIKRLNLRNKVLSCIFKSTVPNFGAGI